MIGATDLKRPGGAQGPVNFHATSISKTSFDAVAEALQSRHLRSGGAFSEKAVHEIADVVGHSRVFLTNSCTSALEIAALALNLGPKDDIVVPSFTFCATATAFARTGARIVLADVNPVTMMVDADTLAEAMSERTRVVVVTHYGGAAAPMQAIRELCAQRGVFLVEDAAQAFGTTQAGQAVGTAGLFAAFSFHETKILSCGHGGALVVNSQDPALLGRVEELLARGTNFPAFRRKEVSHYEWTSVSSSFEMPNLNAALLYGQLKQRSEIFLKCRAIWQFYERRLRHLPIHILRPDPQTRSNGYSFSFLSETRDDGQKLLEQSARFGLGLQSHYKPLHLSRFAENTIAGPCPGATGSWDRLVRLPVHVALTTAQAERICRFLEEAMSDHSL